MDSSAKKSDKEDLKPYLSRISKILSGFYSIPEGISEIFDFLFLGDEEDARNLDLLKSKGITHVINCASTYVDTGEIFYNSSIKRYIGFEAEDDDDYDILQHYDEVKEIIEDARKTNGKAFIHCVMGINRSATLATAYVMMYKNWGPVTAIKHVKDARKTILTNDSFQVQLVKFAKEHDLLHYDT